METQINKHWKKVARVKDYYILNKEYLSPNGVKKQQYAIMENQNIREVFGFHKAVSLACYEQNILIYVEPEEL